MEQVSAQLGQPIIIENRTGAGSTIAMAAAVAPQSPTI
jgi:tripartite-type tricarboxylate transporter receptor subunit TctC